MERLLLIGLGVIIAAGVLSDIMAVYAKKLLGWS